MTIKKVTKKWRSRANAKAPANFDNVSNAK
jgi:hypothetical protein